MRRLSSTVLALLYAFVYATVVTLLVTVAALVLTAASGGGLVRTKVLLFGAGWILMAYAVIRMWPTSPEDLKTHANETLESGVDPGGRKLSRLERTIANYPPTSWLPAVAPDTQLDERTKLFLASVLVLLVSYLLEAVFGAT